MMQVSIVNRFARSTLFFAIALLVPNTSIAQVGFSGRWEAIQSDKRREGPPRHLTSGGITIIESSGKVVLAPDGGEILVYLLGPEGGEITREGQAYRYVAEVTSLPRDGHSITIKETPVGVPFGTSGTIYTSISSTNLEGEVLVMMQRPGGAGTWWSRIYYQAAKPLSRASNPK